MERLVVALDDASRPVLTADSLYELSIVLALGFGDEDVVGPPEIFRGFTEGASWEEVFVSKGSLSVDEADFNAAAQGCVLHSVVQKKGVAAEELDGFEGRAHAVFVDKDNDVAQRAGQHERFVAGKAAIEEKAFPIVNDAGFASFQAEPFSLEAAE